MAAHYEVFSIGDRHTDFAIQRINQSIPSNAVGSQRKAHSNHREWPRTTSEVFADHAFQIDIQGHLDHKGRPVKLRRIYELYDKEFALFDEDRVQQTLAKDRPSYPTFVGQFIMLDLDYVKTLFFQKNMSQIGYYQYFVRRNGEYHVDYVDDSIPVDNEDQEPLWGLRTEEPWKLILMKAWIKERGGIEGVIKAEPFEFIEAFGVPGYRAMSIRKEMDHLKKSRLKQQTKKAKLDKIRFEDPTYLIVGKTRDSEKINQMGLVRHMAAYHVTALSVHKQENIMMSTLKSDTRELFKVRSSIPSKWCGEYSILSPKFNKETVPIKEIKIESEFIITYDELTALFSKFYMVRHYNPEPMKASSFKGYKTNMIEDSYSKRVMKSRPYFFYNLEIESEGIVNVNIEVPYLSASTKQQDNMKKRRYTPLKMIIGRYFTEEELKKFNRDSKDLEIIEYYDGQNVKGYHKNLNRFVQFIKGKYVIYFKVDNSVESTDLVTINISGNAEVASFKELNPDDMEKSAILKSILFSYVKRYCIRTYTADKVKDRIIYLGNSFDELGFGLAGVSVDIRSGYFLGMKVHRDKLKAEHLNMEVCKEAHGLEDEDEEKQVPTLDFLDKGKNPQIVVLEKMDRKSYANEVFPPDGTINFFEVYDKPKSAIK